MKTQSPPADMLRSGPDSQPGQKAVANWIMIGVVMLVIQVVLGGITRLTGSGLSITEWNVVTGALPPLNEAAWLKEFQKYQQTPQYYYLNSDFTVSDFKFIFFWEWFHRLWARLIGVVFLVGFVYLAAKKYLKKEMFSPLFGLFLFGAFQGAIGWIMVASGLTGDAVYVKPTKLAMHFVFAMGLISCAYWYALELKVTRSRTIGLPSLRKFTGWLIVLVYIQLIFGALMAGHKAAIAAPTWPSINGDMVPGGLLRETPAILNFVENKMTIHFIHRGLAYLLLVLIIVYSVKLFKIKTQNTTFNKARKYPLIFVLVQVLLGILSLLTAPSIIPNHWGGFEWMAQLHQITGMLLTLSLVAMLYLIRKNDPAQSA